MKREDLVQRLDVLRDSVAAKAMTSADPNTLDWIVEELDEILEAVEEELA